jgi:hypothetical protein
MSSLARAAAAAKQMMPMNYEDQPSLPHLVLLCSIGIPDSTDIPSHVLTVPDPPQLQSYLQTAISMHISERLPARTFPWQLKRVIKLDTDIQETHLNRKPTPKRPQTTQSKTQPKPKYPRTFNFLAIFQPDDEYYPHTISTFLMSSQVDWT